MAVDEPRKYSVGIDLKDIDRAEYQVCVVSSLQSGLVSYLYLGRFLEVVSKDHGIPQAAQKHP